jgi:hypothetical protein
MNECEIQQASLAQYVADGEPDEREYQALRQHLASCEGCRQALASLRRVEAALWAWPLQEAPAGLTTRILDAIEGEPQVEDWRPLPWSVWVPVLTLLVALALAVWLAPAPDPAFARALPEPRADLLRLWLPEDQGLLWAVWIGVSAVLFGAGITMALVQGRMPNEAEMDHLRHRLSDTAQRLWHLAGR